MTDACVVQLLGYPGMGRYTVAKELVRQMEEAGRPARLLDNHASANLVLSLVPTPTQGIPDDVMDRRVAAPERADRHKLVDPNRLREILEDPAPLPPWDDIVRLDVTSLARLRSRGTA